MKDAILLNYVDIYTELMMSQLASEVSFWSNKKYDIVPDDVKIKISRAIAEILYEASRVS